MYNLNGQVALITGASGNLGQATARAFRAAGARLALIDRSANRLQTTFPELVTAPTVLFTAPYDLADPESTASAVKKIIEKFGRIDILVNTIGGFQAGKPLHETELETLDNMWKLNVLPAFLVSKAVIPQMLLQSAGKIVHVSGRAGLVGGPNSSAYSAAKAAVIRLCESMAAELKANNIQVNCVLPGTIDTPKNHAAQPGADSSTWVTPEAVADVILFLCSPAARNVTGSAVPVYGKG